MNLRQRGFTLLEVVIAISIFALLGMATYRMLDSVLRVDESTRANEQALRELTRTFAALDRDLTQAAPRAIRDGYGDFRPSLQGELGAVDGTAAVELSRYGWLNPLGLSRTQLQRVRWRLSGKRLERVYWTVLDQAVDSQPRVQSMLEGVVSLAFRYMNEEGEWLEQWPPTSSATTEKVGNVLPLAVELRLEHERYGEITRLYRLPEPSMDEKQQDRPAPTEPVVPAQGDAA